MIEWALIGAAIAAGGGAAWAWTRRGQRIQNQTWTPILTALAARYHGYATTGTTNPGVRAAVHGMTVTLTLYDAHLGSRHTRAEADVALPDASNVIRFYLGWDTLGPPTGLDHVPEVHDHGVLVDGEVHVRSDDARAARSFATGVVLDLVDVKREALASALEVIVRGGYLQLAVYGVEASEATLDRLLTVAARLAEHMDVVSRRPSPDERAEPVAP